MQIRWRALASHFINYLGLALESAETAAQAKVAKELVVALTNPATKRRRGAECILFSMDRAMQLDAVLGSYRDNVANSAPIHILYRATTQEHAKAYRDVFKIHSSSISTVYRQERRESFRQQLVNMLEKITSENVFFLVDDDLFIERMNLNDMAYLDTRYFVPSLRMGVNLKESYNLKKAQPLPVFFRLGDVSQPTMENLLHSECDKDELLCWTWHDGVFDWAYPLALDGHIFGTSEMCALIRHVEFDSPNTLEAELQRFTVFFVHRNGVCWRKSRLLNIPCNRVQTDFPNIHGDIHQDALLAKWNKGLRIHYQSMYGFHNTSAHQEIPFNFVKRD